MSSSGVGFVSRAGVKTVFSNFQSGSDQYGGRTNLQAIKDPVVKPSVPADVIVDENTMYLTHPSNQTNRGEKGLYFVRKYGIK